MAKKHGTPSTRKAADVHRFGPWLGAMLIRRVFDRGARRSTIALADGAPPVTVRGFAYQLHDENARLDVYTPVGNVGALPTIVWTHGGAWISGSHTDYAGYHQRLAAAGFTVVSVGYSLAPEHRYPTAIRQLNDAHRYLLANATALHVDPGHMILAGDSAGAQLSAQLATAITNPEYGQQLGLEPSLPAEALRGVVLHCGIYDVPAMASRGVVGWGVGQALWAYTGARQYAQSRAAQQMSTLHHVTGEFPPALISGGNGDPLTPVQSRPMVDRLSELGVDVEGVFPADDHRPALGHEYQFDLGLAESRDLLDRTIRFVRKVPPTDGSRQPPSDPGAGLGNQPSGVIPDAQAGDPRTGQVGQGGIVPTGDQQQ